MRVLLAKTFIVVGSSRLKATQGIIILHHRMMSVFLASSGTIHIRNAKWTHNSNLLLTTGGQTLFDHIDLMLMDQTNVITEKIPPEGAPVRG